MKLVNPRRVVLSAALVGLLLLAACGGADSTEDSTSADNGSSGVVAAEPGDEATSDGSAEEELSTEDIDGGDEELTLEELQEEVGSDDGATDRIEVAEEEIDPLDSMLNAMTVFRVCLEDDGFEFQGAPGIDGAQADEFSPDYMAALGKCAAESNILASLEAFGSSTADFTPEEIERQNFGFPHFRECLIRLGWTVAEIAPDETGLLTVPLTNGFQPPEGQSLLETNDINTCRQEAETYTAENFVEEE